MKRVYIGAAGLVLAGAAWLFFHYYEIVGLDQVAVQPRTAVSTTAASAVPARATDAIRIASFNIQVFGESKLQEPDVMEVLANVVRQFDVVAIQEVRAKSQDVLPRFVELINAGGAQYDYVIGPRLGRTSSKEQYAFVFDRATIEIDPRSLYTVEDPDDLLHREPFVAGFRARGPPETAFTFTLINIHTDPDEVPQEMAALDDVYRAVQRDGRNEDDVILLGDLNADDQALGPLGAVSGIAWAISGTPTNTRGTKQYDNLLFHREATTEFTGQAGVLDLMREFNLSQTAALEVSDHLPVWAEFSTLENGRPGRIAIRPPEGARQ